MSPQLPRYPALFLASALVTTVLLLLVSLPGDSRLINALQNSGHYLLFALLSLIALWTLRSSSEKSLWPVLLGCLLFGMFLEGMQSIIGREASLYDLLLNALGVAAGGLLFAGLIRCSIPSVRSITLVALLSVIAISAPLYWLLVYQVRSTDFPKLINLDHLLANAILQGSYGGDVQIVKRPPNWPADLAPDTMNTALISLGDGPWPGVKLIEPEADWRGYQLLELQLFSELTHILPLTLRINDRIHNNQHKDRLNHRLELNHGHNWFEIPLTEIENAPRGRQMNLSAISDVLLFGEKDAKGSKFYLISMRLR